VVAYRGGREGHIQGFEKVGATTLCARNGGEPKGFGNGEMGGGKFGSHMALTDRGENGESG